MQIGPWQILIIAVVVLVLFGRGKISNLMGEVGKGITAFKKGVKETTADVDVAAAPDVAQVPRDVTPMAPEKDKA